MFQIANGKFPFVPLSPVPHFPFKPMLLGIPPDCNAASKLAIYSGIEPRRILFLPLNLIGFVNDYVWIGPGLHAFKRLRGTLDLYAVA